MRGLPWLRNSAGGRSWRAWVSGWASSGVSSLGWFGSLMQLEAAFWGTIQARGHHAWYGLWSTERSLHRHLTWTTGWSFQIQAAKKRLPFQRSVGPVPLTTKAVACTCGQIFYEREPGAGQELIAHWVPDQRQFFSEI